jgi:ribonuclease P protein component
MLPSQKRLSRLEFDQFLKKDHQVVFNRLGTLKYQGEKGLKVSIVTSSKHEKSAVLRNKLRRRLYSLFRLHSPSLYGVFYVSKHAYTMEYNEIKDLYNDLLKKTTK